MIKSFRHKGLARFYRTGDTRGINATFARRLSWLLAALDTAGSITDMDIQDIRLHPLKGTGKGTWSIVVNANWRLTFRFMEGHVHVLDYEDYH